MSAYQFSSYPSHLVTALSVDGFHQPTSVLLKGNNAFLDLHGALTGQYRTGPHYINIRYHTPVDVTFTDCKKLFKNNKNLYAMMLPPSCKVISINPTTCLMQLQHVGKDPLRLEHKKFHWITGQQQKQFKLFLQIYHGNVYKELSQIIA